MIKSFMQMQDKLDVNYGRKRKKTSIGFYDLDLLKPPILYTTVDPNAVKFVPLGFTKRMTPAEILLQHPKGIEYGPLINKFKEVPILIDSDNKIMSMPPVINSNDLGNVNEKTRNLLIEVTGTDQPAVMTVLGIICVSLAERGGKIFSTKIVYKGKDEYVTAPQLEPLEFEVKPSYIKNRIGLNLSAKELSKVLEKMGYEVVAADELKDSLTLLAPFYRKDVMHSADIAEDVAIGYNYNNIEPAELMVPTIGELSPSTKKIDLLREMMIGLGQQEILSFMLTNKETVFTKMCHEHKDIVEIENPISSNWDVVRNSLTPIVMNFLSVNKTIEFPQKIFELGDVITPDSRRENMVRQDKHLCAAITHPKVTFIEIKSVLDKLFADLNLECSIRAVENPSFISGRCGEIILNKKSIGMIGEIHPQVLENFGLENPVSIFEIDVDDI
jgi:phenylalanyl-tRNA synthetase beta chain